MAEPLCARADRFDAEGSWGPMKVTLRIPDDLV
jgi:hypothetical protein